MYKYTEKMKKLGMVKCPNCPIAIEPDQNYCGNCGKRLQGKIKITGFLLKRGRFKMIWELMKE